MVSDSEWNQFLGEVFWLEEEQKEEKSFLFLARGERENNLVGEHKPMENLSFHKEERLKSKKSIEELFKKGSSFYLNPFLFKYLKTSNEESQVLIAVPKKLHKKAVNRNLIKRRIREAYRLNKSILSDLKSSHNLGFLYQSKDILPFQAIEKKLITLFHRLAKESGIDSNS